jgi:hypothetical protein
MNKTALVLILALGLGLGYLAATHFAPKPVVVAAPKPVVVDEPAPAPKAKAPRAVEAPVNAKSEEQLANEEFKAKAKAFGEETKKMVEEIAGGDQAKLQRAMFAGMMKPEGQAIMKEMRELGDAFRKATPAEREALGAQAVALRDRALAALRVEIAAQDAAAAGGAPAPAPGAAPAAPAQPPVIIM